MSGLGFILAASSAVFNGSFAAFSKLPSVQRAGTEPVIFNLYVCLGVFVSGFFAIPFYSLSKNEVGITGAGMVAGMLFVLAGLFSFLAIPELGLAIAQGVWGGSAVLVSFLWGAVGPTKVRGLIGSIGGSVGAVTLLLIGIFGIIWSQTLSKTLASKADGYGNENAALLDRVKGSTAVNSASARKKRKALGFVYAALVGIFGGSILVPLSYVPEPEKYGGLGFLPAFGVGCAILGIVVTAGFYGLVEKRRPSFDVKASLLPGLAAGFVWNCGNVCSIYAMDPTPNVPGSSGLSYGVAYPMMQCALFISGIWGIFVFKEIKGIQAIAAFFVFGGILLGGAAMLGAYGPQTAKSGNNTNLSSAMFSAAGSFGPSYAY